MSVVFVTGGTGAIGKAIVKRFAESEDVIFTYKNREKAAEQLCRECRCECIRMDTADRESAVSGITETIRKYGHIDILVNNAGIAQFKLFTEITPEEWREIINVNLTGYFNVAQAAVRGMISRKKGAVINISSVWGVHGASCESAYSASKAGVIGLTKALAKELGACGITVNCIAPGVIESPMNSGLLTKEELSELAERTPLMRLGKPEEVAEAVYSVSQNPFITGQVIGVDGGFY